MSEIRTEGKKAMLEEGTKKIKGDFDNYGLQLEVEAKQKEFSEMVERMQIVS